MEEYQDGQKVQFTSQRLGILDLHKGSFALETVSVGDEGHIISTPDPLPDGWVMVRVTSPILGLVPVHPSMIEPVPA